MKPPQGPLKTVKRPKPKKFKYKIGDVIAVRFVPELAEQNPDIESYCNKYFMVQVVGYTDYPTSLSRHPLIEQCGGVVALDWMGDTIPDMEEFAKAPMLDLTVLWWPIRSFAVTTMFGANAVQCTVIGNTEIKFEQDVPERVTMLNEARTWKYVVLDIVRAYQKQHPQNNT